MSDVVRLRLTLYEYVQLRSAVATNVKALADYKQWVSARPNLPLHERALAELEGERHSMEQLAIKLLEASKPDVPRLPSVPEAPEPPALIPYDGLTYEVRADDVYLLTNADEPQSDEDPVVEVRYITACDAYTFSLTQYYGPGGIFGMTITQPWARAWRTFLAALAADTQMEKER